tara:strand:+ start:262 stop:441 length:180 start_codon:yes stop_codon:yes gene_type:complete
MNILPKINTNPTGEKIKKYEGVSPTVYSPASVVDNISKITANSKSNKKIWKKSKLSKIK